MKIEEIETDKNELTVELLIQILQGFEKDKVVKLIDRDIYTSENERLKDVITIYDCIDNIVILDWKEI